jgi:hypothetical protein
VLASCRSRQVLAGARARPCGPPPVMFPSSWLPFSSDFGASDLGQPPLLAGVPLSGGSLVRCATSLDQTQDGQNMDRHLCQCARADGRVLARNREQPLCFRLPVACRPGLTLARSPRPCLDLQDDGLWTTGGAFNGTSLAPTRALFLCSPALFQPEPARGLAGAVPLGPSTRSRSLLVARTRLLQQASVTGWSQW